MLNCNYFMNTVPPISAHRWLAMQGVLGKMAVEQYLTGQQSNC